MIGFNPILGDYPSSIRVGNTKYYINTDFRVWLEYLQAVKAQDTERVERALTVILPHTELTEDIMSELVNFFLLSEHRETTEGLTETDKRIKDIQQVLKDKGDIVFDLFVDVDCIVSDFLREYHINLTDKALQLHWLEFKLLLNNLSCNSAVEKRKELRNLKTKDVAKDKKETLVEVQSVYKIVQNKTQLTAKQRDELMLELSHLLYKQAEEKEW